MPNDLEPVEPRMSNDTATRVFGGSPLGVIVRLILVSILVGVILTLTSAYGVWNALY